MKKYYKKIIAVFLLMLAISGLFINRQLIKKTKTLKSRLAVYTSVINRDANYLIEEIIHSTDIVENIMVASLTGDTVKLINTDGFRNGVRLIFMYNQINCPSCTQVITENIKENIELNNMNDKIIIIGKYDTVDIIRNNKKYWGDNYVYGFVDYSSSGIASLDRPFFILVDSNCFVRDIFIPDASNPNKIATYLKTYSYLFESNMI